MLLRGTQSILLSLIRRPLSHLPLQPITLNHEQLVIHRKTLKVKGKRTSINAPQSTNQCSNHPFMSNAPKDTFSSKLGRYYIRGGVPKSESGGPKRGPLEDSLLSPNSRERMLGAASLARCGGCDQRGRRLSEAELMDARRVSVHQVHESRLLP